MYTFLHTEPNIELRPPVSTNVDFVCVIQFSERRSPSGSAVRNHGRAHPAPCVRHLFVVCLRARVQFCRFNKADATAAFSDTAITDRHSDTAIFQLRAHWVRISWSIGSEKSFGHVPPVVVEPFTPCVNGEHPIH